MAKQFDAELVLANSDHDGRTDGEVVIPLNLSQSVKVMESITFGEPLLIRFIRTSPKGIVGGLGQAS